jgi:hypothetical protein
MGVDVGDEESPMYDGGMALEVLHCVLVCMLVVGVDASDISYPTQILLRWIKHVERGNNRDGRGLYPDCPVAWQLIHD